MLDDKYSPVPPSKPNMLPVNLEGCFGWLHSPPDNRVADTAVVLCPGLSTDAMTGYRTYRQLANALACAGYPTLRIQYPDTGNSATPAPSEHWQAWQDSIHHASGWLRDHCGATRIILCGFRLGALLASVVAAHRSDVAGLVLIAPVLRGRTWIRQLMIEANLRSDGTAAGTAGERRLVMGELVLSPVTVRLIDQADLRRIALPSNCRVAVYAQMPTAVLSECVDAWVRSKLQVTCNAFTGLEPMLRPVFMNHETQAAVNRVVDWLRIAVPVGASATRRMPLPASPEFRTQAWIETPLTFGQDGALFAILCRPADARQTDLAVIIGNSSGDPHCVAVTVDLARRFAAAGIASLRMDFLGIGDSAAPDDVGSHIFETDRAAEVTAAIDLLAAQGYRTFATHGLCSGAYHALHGAVGDPRVSAALLVNLPLFEWHKGDAVENVGLETRGFERLIQLLSSRQAWKQVLSGQMNLCRKLAWPRVWISLKVYSLARRLGRALRLGNFPSVGEDCMNRLSTRTRTLFLYAENDAGTIMLSQAFGAERTPPGARVEIISGLDHSLTGSGMRRVAAEHMIEFLREDEAWLASPRCGDATAAW